LPPEHTAVEVVHVHDIQKTSKKNWWWGGGAGDGQSLPEPGPEASRGTDLTTIPVIRAVLLLNGTEA
jgi:hypothetical protein